MKSLQIAGNSSYGGGDYLLLRWCRYLLSRNVQVDVLVTDPYVVEVFQQIPEINVIDTIMIQRDIDLGKQIRAFRQLLALLQQEQYDVVHTYTATPGFIGRITARLANVPVVLHHQAGWAVNEFSTLTERIIYTPLEYIATLASTRTICVSHADAINARTFRVAPLFRLVTICNGIDPEPFIAATQSNRQPLRQELGIADDCLIIGNTGRLAQQKDNETLIRSLVPLKRMLNGRSFVLLLAGTGPDRQPLEELAHMLGLTSHVQFLGFRNDIPDFLASLDIFASPSLWEGLSISIMEAMAASRPIVTTTILPNAELIEPEVTGLLVPPRQPEEVAQAIARFAHDPALAQRCATAACERVTSAYTIDRMFDETWELYVDLLARKTQKHQERLIHER